MKKLLWALWHSVTLFIVVSGILSYFGTISLPGRAGAQTIVRSDVLFERGDTPIDPNEVLKEVNQIRISHGLSPMSPDADLARLASERAHDMVSREYYAHENPDGHDFYDLMKLKGNAPSYGCENLALESSNTTNPYVMSWYASKNGHKECMLNTNVNRAGYAVQKLYDAHESSDAKPYYVVVAIHATN